MFSPPQESKLSGSAQMKHQGFTLLELSIVLVIIGLIIGGITVGQEMIKSAELNSVVTDVTKYTVAVNTFKLKYDALPGDMDNATAYWGAAHATPATCWTTAGTGTQTCDGDGDGEVNSLHYTPTGAHEHWRFWEHLSNSEILSGDFTGIVPAAGSLSSPESKLANAQWHFYYVDGASSWGKATSARHVLSLSTATVLATGAAGAGVMSAPDLYSIEKKIDDGMANSGTITDPNSGGALAAGAGGIGMPDAALCSDSTILDGDYRLSSDSIDCTPIFDVD
ncbi:MAG: prepilin-type N-terminal cleavage/methylation domain-containing protein [Rickettsiales bacterium]|nr:prepilin-type N-terminal cleavage/methylation domain-containing protein [Rickettsiales bacterium]